MSSVSHFPFAGPTRVCITGTLRIGGHPITSARAVELLYLLVHEGPVLPKILVEDALYGGYCSRSSLWYPLKVCQDAGVDISYDRSRKAVVLKDDLEFDIDFAFDYLAEGNLEAALWMLGGWPGGKGSGSYTEQLTDRLRAAIADTPYGSSRSVLEDAYGMLDERRSA
ncbi:MAG TPA: hypothetical protein H9870_06400 [Candidatus Corynebacterium avicola]|uniref:Uncharacterized protein n=1 Tax=Candidatus Corynebacterium avicola TaxID=2838527 RepID=A0A9D1UKI1_9CORY|nr:hypothetical protein [Candidatus Corynebacterium avicola]